MHPEIIEHVVVHTDISADPHVNCVAFAKLRKATTAGDTFDRREQPERQQNARIDSVAAGLSFNRLVARMELRKVEAANIT